METQNLCPIVIRGSYSHLDMTGKKNREFHSSYRSQADCILPLDHGLHCAMQNWPNSLGLLTQTNLLRVENVPLLLYQRRIETAVVLPASGPTYRCQVMYCYLFVLLYYGPTDKVVFATCAIVSLLHLVYLHQQQGESPQND